MQSTQPTCDKSVNQFKATNSYIWKGGVDGAKAPNSLAAYVDGRLQRRDGLELFYNYLHPPFLFVTSYSFLSRISNPNPGVARFGDRFGDRFGG